MSFRNDVLNLSYAYNACIVERIFQKNGLRLFPSFNIQHFMQIRSVNTIFFKFQFNNFSFLSKLDYFLPWLLLMAFIKFPLYLSGKKPII